MPYMRVLVDCQELAFSFAAGIYLFSCTNCVLPSADIRTSRNTVRMEGQEMCSQLRCRNCDWLFAGNTDPLLSTPCQAYSQNHETPFLTSSATLALRHSMRAAAVFQLLFEGVLQPDYTRASSVHVTSLGRAGTSGPIAVQVRNEL